MNKKILKKWWELQNNTFSPNEFELILKLYTGEHINIGKDITGKLDKLSNNKKSPQDSLFAKGIIEKNGLNGYGYSLTGSGWSKMEEINKLVEKNCFQRWLYKLNQYPVAISIISSIIGAGIAIFGQYFSK